MNKRQYFSKFIILSLLCIGQQLLGMDTDSVYNKSDWQGEEVILDPNDLKEFILLQESHDKAVGSVKAEILFKLVLFWERMGNIVIAYQLAQEAMGMGHVPAIYWLGQHKMLCGDDEKRELKSDRLAGVTSSQEGQVVLEEEIESIWVTALQLLNEAKELLCRKDFDVYRDEVSSKIGLSMKMVDLLMKIKYPKADILFIGCKIINLKLKSGKDPQLLSELYDLALKTEVIDSKYDIAKLFLSLHDCNVHERQLNVQRSFDLFMQAAQAGHLKSKEELQGLLPFIKHVGFGGAASAQVSSDTSLLLLESAKRVGAGFLGRKKILPNESCPCDSGKKYKKCCGINK